MMFLAVLLALTFAASDVPLLNQADTLREQGKSLEAIELYNILIVQAANEKEDQTLVSALTGQILSWKHLYYKTNDKVFAILVKTGTESLERISKEKGLQNKHLVYFLKGQADLLLQEYSSAEQSFQSALIFYPSNDAQKGDWTAHLGEALYLSGKKEEGKAKLLEGIDMIQAKAKDVDPFLIHVWTSGAYLRLAKLLKHDDPAASQLYLDKAKEIIDSDPKLVIRKQQLDSVSQ